MKLLESAIYFLAGLASGIAVALTGSGKVMASSRARGSSGTRESTPNDSLKMVLVVNQSLKMAKGKIAAQCAHAACGCVESAEQTDAGRRKLRAWRAQGQKKIALTATQDEVLRLERSLRNAGINCCLIRDAGKTQVAAGSKTVLGVGPDTDDRIDGFTSTLRLLFLGKFLGAGVQAAVYELVFADGTSTGRVLKLGHENLSHKILLGSMATSMMSLQKEWEIGMQLKAAMEGDDGQLRGFTRTCDCMAVYGDSKSKQVVFRGLMMEKIQGYSVASRVTDPTFHNIHYIREMLFQVFSALDTAQRRTGFCHADLGLNNVMEHYPVMTETLVEKERSQNLLAMRESGGDEFEKASNDDRKSCTPGKDENTWSRTGTDGCKIPPPVCGWSCNVDGSKMPLGPQVEFKLIDYGVAEFNETLAHAAGGYEAEETLAAIHAEFGERGIPVGATANEDMLRLMNNSGHQIKEKLRGKKWGKHGRTKSRGLMLRKVDKEDRFFVVMESAGSKESRDSNGSSTPSTPNSVKLSNAMSNTTSIQAGVVEKMYRSFWSRKGDVFHLLLSLAITLDDRVWPKRDERDVQMFCDLVYHITGVTLRAWFQSGNDGKALKVMGRRWKNHGEGNNDESDYDAFAFGSRERLFRWMRRGKMLWSAHMRPLNSACTAAEALVSPFFGPNRSPPHAELPVCVSAAFPFRQR